MALRFTQTHRPRLIERAPRSLRRASCTPSAGVSSWARAAEKKEVCPLPMPAIPVCRTMSHDEQYFERHAHTAGKALGQPAHVLTDGEHAILVHARRGELVVGPAGCGAEAERHDDKEAEEQPGAALVDGRRELVDARPPGVAAAAAAWRRPTTRGALLPRAARGRDDADRRRPSRSRRVGRAARARNARRGAVEGGRSSRLRQFTSTPASRQSRAGAAARRRVRRRR